MNETASAPVAVPEKQKEPKPLQSCQATWVQDQDDNMWVIRDADGKELFQLPARLNEKEVMSIIHAARKYELEAFNTGKEYGSQAMQAVMKNKLVEMDMKIMVLERQNQELAEHLDRIISGE